MGTSHCEACTGCSYPRAVGWGLVVRGRRGPAGYQGGLRQKEHRGAGTLVLSPRSDVLCCRIRLSIPQICLALCSRITPFFQLICTGSCAS